MQVIKGTRIYRIDPLNPEGEAIDAAALSLASGGGIAFPTETVYGLGAHLFNETALASLMAMKGRPEGKPLPVMVASLEMLRELVVEIPESARKAMEKLWPGPLTIVFRSRAELSPLVTGGTGTVGVRYPNHSAPLAIIQKLGSPIVAPSANLSGLPPPCEVEEIIEIFAGKVEVILDGGKTGGSLPSTVLDCTHSPPRILRPGALSREALSSALGRDMS